MKMVTQASSHFVAFSHGGELLHSHGGGDGAKALVLTGSEDFSGLGDDVLEPLVLGNLQVLFYFGMLIHKGHVALVVDVDEGVLLLGLEGSVDVVTGGEGALVFVRGEDVDTGDHGLGSTVLAGLGGGETDDLARVALDHDEGAVLEATSLNLLDTGGTGISLLELIIVVLFHLAYFKLISNI